LEKAETEPLLQDNSTIVPSPSDANHHDPENITVGKELISGFHIINMPFLDCF